MMFRKHNRKTVPGLNTSSTADISFMLLILFLVTTSMDVDKGLSHQLPPIDKTKKEQQMVDSRHIMIFRITENNKFVLDEKPIPLSQIKPRVKEFVQRNEKKHIIQLEANRKSAYNSYFQLQNEIISAYNILRNQRAARTFGKTYELCSPEQQAQINNEIPIRISEVYEPSTNETSKGGNPKQ